MTRSLRLLVALAGGEDPGLVTFVARLGADEVDQAVALTLLHVVDSEPHEVFGRGPEARRAPWPGASRGTADPRIAEAEEASAAALLAAWGALFIAYVPGAVVGTATRHGRPEREIVDAARPDDFDAVVLCPRPRVGLTEPGPRGVGRVARFVVDHAAVPVILVRHRG